MPGMVHFELIHFNNNVHEWYRNRIEHVIAVIKSHRMFQKGCYQGSYAHLAPLVTIVGHVTSFELRMRQRFDTIGSWWHCY